LGREEKIKVVELVLKAKILGNMEEDLNELKEKSNTLLNTLESYAKENKTRDNCSTSEPQQTIGKQVLKTSKDNIPLRGYQNIYKKRIVDSRGG